MKASVEWVSIEELDLRFSSLRLNHPAQLTRLRASVEREGVRQPVLAATEVAGPLRVLVDGFKRVRVARELGTTRLHASLVALDGPSALAMMVRTNGAQRGMSALEEGWIVQRLCREHGMTQAEAGRALEREQSWVSHRLRLVEQLEEGLQEDLRLGLMMPATARELGRLPRTEQQRVAEVVRAHGLGSRQVARLVRRLLCTDDPAMRRALLLDPFGALALKSAAPSAKKRRDDRLTACGNELRQNLLLFEGAASRLGSRLLCLAGEDLGAEASRILAPLISQASAAGGRVLGQLNELRHGRAASSGAVGAHGQELGATNAQPPR